MDDLTHDQRSLTRRSNVARHIEQHSTYPYEQACASAAPPSPVSFVRPTDRYNAICHIHMPCYAISIRVYSYAYEPLDIAYLAARVVNHQAYVAAHLVLLLAGSLLHGEPIVSRFTVLDILTQHESHLAPVAIDIRVSLVHVLVLVRASNRTEYIHEVVLRDLILVPDLDTNRT